MIQAPQEQGLVDRAGQAFTRFQAGDRTAFDELVQLLTPLMWRTVRGAGVDPVAAEDVVQTVWMNLLHSADNVREPRTVTKWLLTATKRESWRVARRTRDDRDRRTAAFGTEDDEVVEVVSSDAQPDETVLLDDRQRVLWSHVKGLPERCRQLLSVIAFADRPDYAGLAEALGMPVGSIGPTRGRCLAKLRERLGRDPLWEGQLS
jgi:RNA polymerase sigma factor (sigma-70 family)